MGAEGAAPMEGQDKAQARPADLPAGVAVGDWEDVPAPPLSPRSYASGAWLGGEFYLVGGQLDPPCPANADCMAPSRRLRDGASYDPLTRTWQPISPAPVAISEAPPVVVGGSLYYLVRMAGSNKVFAYDTADDVWTQLPSPKGDGQLVAAGERLLSIAYSNEEPGAVDQVFDPTLRTWLTLPSDPLGKSYGRSAVWVDGKVLLYGARVPAASAPERAPLVRLAELDLRTRTWRRLPDSEVVGGGAVVAGGLVVFPNLGSADGGEVHNWGRSYPMGGIYDAATGTWLALPRLDHPEEGVRFAWSGGSVAGDLVLASGHLLDPAQGTWTRLTPPPGGNLDGQTVIASPEGLLVFGGWDGSAQTARSSYLPFR